MLISNGLSSKVNFVRNPQFMLFITYNLFVFVIFSGIQNEKSTITGVGATSSSDVETCEDCLKRSFSDCFSKMWFHRRLPCTKWIPQYSASYLLRDFIAGITVGLTAIPQGIAYANVAGLQPQVLII